MFDSPFRPRRGSALCDKTEIVFQGQPVMVTGVGDKVHEIGRMMDSAWPSVFRDSHICGDVWPDSSLEPPGGDVVFITRWWWMALREAFVVPRERGFNDRETAVFPGIWRLMQRVVK
jgi:hypothetical protein